MNPVGEFRIPDAEGETLHLADVGETLRLKYHRVTRLWRATAKAVHRRGKPLQQQGSNLSGIRDRVKARWLSLSFSIMSGRNQGRKDDN